MIYISTNICKGIDESKICPFGLASSAELKNHCSRCYQQKFPEDAAKRKMLFRSKEILVKNFVSSNYEGFIHDRAIYTPHCDCTLRRRIDLRKTVGNTVLAIEVDEFQHDRYSDEQKDARINDLYMAFSGKFIYIRFNPDFYKDNAGKRRKTVLKSRLPRLKQEIDKQIERIKNEENKELVEEIYLFHDGFNDE